MLEIFNHALSWVCGQNPDHTWMPGGLPLPCCQRCIGLYVGAGVAALLHIALKPQPTARFLQVHGLFLLLMVPFGFHWLPQGEVLRGWTGVLFGFGLVMFLSQTLSARSNDTENSTSRIGTVGLYWLGLVLTLLAVPVLGVWGGRGSSSVLSSLAALGALVLASLALANVGLAIASLARGSWRRKAQVRA